MNIHIKAGIYLLLFLYSMVAFSQEQPSSTPQIVFKVSLGETLTVGDIDLKFVEVLEDSRCPKDAVCVWAGQARVHVTVSGDRITTKKLDLIVDEKEKNILGVFEGFTFKAVGLTPYPSSGNTRESLYTLLVLKEKI